MDSIFRWDNGLFHITTDRSLLDIDAIHQYLTVSTWAKGIDKKTVAGAIEKSICFGLFYKSKQIGFARVVTDGFTFGYLCDVYVLNEWRNQKLGNWLIKCCHSHPIIQRLRRIMLVTSTASWLYEKHNYTPINEKNFVWQVFRPDIYEK